MNHKLIRIGFEVLVDVIAYTIIAIGFFFVISSIVGLFRFPDFYTKMHAASVADSFGIHLCLLGLALMQTSIIAALKIILIMGILFLLSPTASYALVKAAHLNKLKPYKKK